MEPRLRKTLIAVAHRYAPAQVSAMESASNDASPEDAQAWAGALATEGVLLLMGDLPPALYEQSGVLFKAWADHYLALYGRLCAALFPSFTTINAFYADDDFPPIIGLAGEAAPVIAVLAGYVAPYAAAKADSRLPLRTQVSDVELRGLMDMILDELEAGDLPSGTQRALRMEGATILRALLAEPVQPILLTPPAPALRDTGLVMRDQAPAPPANLPESGRAITNQPPPSMPETIPSAAAPPPPTSMPETGALMTINSPLETGTPIFFQAARRGKPATSNAEPRGTARLPVPDLPVPPPLPTENERYE